MEKEVHLEKDWWNAGRKARRRQGICGLETGVRGGQILFSIRLKTDVNMVEMTTLYFFQFKNPFFWLNFADLLLVFLALFQNFEVYCAAQIIPPSTVYLYLLLNRSHFSKCLPDSADFLKRFQKEFYTSVKFFFHTMHLNLKLFYMSLQYIAFFTHFPFQNFRFSS